MRMFISACPLSRPRARATALVHVRSTSTSTSKANVCVKTTFSRRRPLLENLLSGSTFEIRVDVYERQLAFSSRRLKSASTFMNVNLRFHVDV